MFRHRLSRWFSFTFLLCIVIGGPVMVQADCLTGATPVGYWQLEENSPTTTTFADASVTGNSGSCTACPTRGSGQVDLGQAFAGAHQIDIPSNAAYDFSSGSFAIELWMTAAAHPTGIEVMVGRYTVNAAWWVGLDTDGHARFSLRDNDSESQMLTGSTDIADGSWHHIVAVRDGSGSGQNLLYVDGVLEDSASPSYTNDFTASAAVTIGDDNSGDFDFTGSIDEVAIYGNALSAALVRQLHINSAQNAGYCEDLAPALVADSTEAALGAEIFWTVESAANPSPPTYGLGSNAPVGMSIGGSSGQISWVPLDTSASPTTFDVTADNGVGSADTASFSITLTDMCSAANMVGYWQLEENSPTDTTFTDASNTGNNGTCTACPTQGGGQVDFGQTFEGAEQIDIPSNTLYNFAIDGSFAIELWMTAAAPPSGIEVMVGRYDAAGMAWWVGLDTNGYARFSLRDSDAISQMLTGSTDIADGSWHHIVAVRDGSGSGQNLLYVDGVLEDSAIPSYTGNFTASAIVTIGDDASGPYDFTGSIDEVAIYGRVLTETMVVQHSMLAQGYCNAAPSISSAAPTGPATEDVEFTHTFTAADADGDTDFTWSLTNAPSGMSVNSGTGALTWTPGDVASSGSVTVNVSDSVGGTATQAFTITVTNVNDAPVISTTAPTTATVGTEYSYDADATDDDTGDTLTWSKVSGPDALSIDSASGLVTWTPTNSDSETTNVTIMVSDGNGGSDTEDITITVSGGSSGGGGGGGGGSCFIDSISQ